MSPHPTPIDPNTEETAHYREVLRKLVDMGLEMAADLHGQATAPAAEGTTKPDLTIPFDRITRAIRRTILLAQKLSEPATKPDRVQARKRIIREVEDQIERHSYRENIDPDAIRAELGDRLDSLELEADLENLPLEEIIVHLCSDLGVGKMPNARINQWRRRTPKDIEILNQQAAQEPDIPPNISGSGAGRPRHAEACSTRRVEGRALA